VPTNAIASVSELKTITIYPEQKAQLDELKKAENESYQSVVDRLIENYEASTSELSESRVREIVRDEITDTVVSEARR
jgi:predicted CopG family antitoxin